MSSERLEGLFERHLAGELSPAEGDELAILLDETPGAARRFAAMAHDHVALTEALGRPLPDLPGFPGADAPTSAAHANIIPLPNERWGAIAAAAFIALLTIAFSFRSSGHGTDPGTDLNADRAQIADVGHRLDLHGTQVVFHEPSLYIVDNRATPIGRRPVLELLDGHAEFITAAGSRGIQVRTPRGVLRDIGTRFEVRVQGRSKAMGTARLKRGMTGLVTLAVFAGLVEWTPSDPNETRIIDGRMGRITLTDDGSIGKVSDREGLGQVRSRNNIRWQLARAGTAVQPGDLLRTGSRGANALAIRLSNGTDLVLGPGAQVEIKSVAEIVVHSGDLEVRAPKGVTVDVSGPDRKTTQVTGTQVVRVASGRLNPIAKAPTWLKGYHGDRSTEAMGSLVANVDGRDVSLTIGYHKVSVDIHDQIARTVIEESFLNHTRPIVPLEGVFYFPLPAGASVSSFAMWVGNEKVEADIVEKSRAREIYETILREKRDPGLLEWTGGNLFKARIYPIHASKRIQISYTQVLPRRGDTFAYRYALRSEMTRLTPLKQLNVDVRVWSSVDEIADVSCPTHPCRINPPDPHAARVEFSAQEYTPEQDLEIRVRTRRPSSPVTAMAHRRGDQGFFMVMVDAPAAGNGDAPNPPRAPLDLVVIADTSGSMEGPPRKAQLAFLEALLAELADGDTFQVLTGDTKVAAAFPQRVPNTAGNREQAMAFVEARTPLGWSDVGLALAEAFERSRNGTHVVYLGDGVVTHGAENASSLLSDARTRHRGRGNVHAVALGSQFDALVLGGLARLGAGSFRVLGSDVNDAALTAVDLVDELSHPGLTDLKVDVTGIDVTALRPTDIPNLPRGRQAVLVGRYDPRSPNVKGQVVVTALQAGKPVRVTTPLDVTSADRGNSFIPRLWARRELDHLITEGSTPELRDQIITLSEDYQIMTPYTSFLVLESDADRARFGVKKRFRMRDGQEYFAKGRDEAEFALKRKQMLLAKLWRKGLRRDVLKLLNGMGRDLTSMLSLARPSFGNARDLELRERMVGLGESRLKRFYAGGALGPMDGGRRSSWTATPARHELRDFAGFDGELAPPGREILQRRAGEWADNKSDLSDRYSSDGAESLYKRSSGRAQNSFGSMDGRGLPGLRLNLTPSGFGRGVGGFDDEWNRSRHRRVQFVPDSLFPSLPGAVATPQPIENPWPKSVRDLVAPLNRRATISAGDQRFRILVTDEPRDDRDRVIGTRQGVYLLAKDGWWTTAPHLVGDDASHAWSFEKERGVLTDAWRFGRIRSAKPGDERAFASPFPAWFNDLTRGWARWTPKVEKLADGRVRLSLTLKTSTAEILIDPAKAAILEVKQMRRGKQVQRYTSEDLVQKGGVWWPTRVVTRNGDDKVTQTQKIDVAALDAGAFTASIRSELKRKSSSIILPELPKHRHAARQAIKDGTATLADHWALLRTYGQQQRWAEAEPFQAEFLKRTAGRLGHDRLQMALFRARGRKEERRVLMLQMARTLAATARPSDRAAAMDLFANERNMPGNELVELVQTLRAVHTRTERLEAEREWYGQYAYCFGRRGDWAGRRDAWKTIAEKYPFHVQHHVEYATHRILFDDLDAAIAGLESARKTHGPWKAAAERALRRRSIELQTNAFRYAAAVRAHEAWMRDATNQPDSRDHDRYLSLMVRLERESRADELVRTWLEAGAVEKPSRGIKQRRSAAMTYALGGGWQLWYRHFDAKWAGDLARLARFLIDSESERGVVSTILQSGSFMKTREGHALRNELVRRLIDGVVTADLAWWLDVARWVQPHYDALEYPKSPWDDLAKKLLDRWIASGAADENLGVRAFVDGRGKAELMLKYRRHAITLAKTSRALAQARMQLFSKLLDGDWSADVEKEALGVWRDLGVTQDVAGITSEQALVRARAFGLYRFMLWRQPKKTRSVVEGLADFNTLTRRELAGKRTEIARTVDQEAVALLRGLEDTAEPGAVREWVRLERLWHQSRAGDLGPKDADVVWRMVRPIVAKWAKKEAMDVDVAAAVMAERAVGTLARIAVVTKGGDDVAKALLAFLDASQEPDTGAIDTRMWRSRLLVGLDRPQDLTPELERWFGDGKRAEGIRWGRILSRLRAETGDLDAAIKIFEAIEAHIALSAADYRTLAAWHTAKGAKDAARAAKIRAFDTMSEWQLSSWVRNQARRHQTTGDLKPDDFDPDVPPALVTLFRKSTNPGQHLSQLRDLWSSTADFRLLACLADAIVGQTDQQVYPFLKGLWGFLSRLDDEATLDQLSDAIAKARAEHTPTGVDLRALNMLELMTRFRAVRQAGGTEEHIRATMTALAACQRGTWKEGEREKMAALLATMSGLQPRRLTTAIGDWLRDLHVGEKAGTLDRCRIAFHRARFLFDIRSGGEALALQERALKELRAAHAGQVPGALKSQLAEHTGRLASAGRHRGAEAIWLSEQKLPYGPTRLLWTELQLLSQYATALKRNAEVSIGKGRTLWDALEDRLEAALLRKTDQRHANRLLSQRTAVWRDRWKKGSLREDVTRRASDFAYGTLPRILAMYRYGNGQGMVSAIASFLEDTSGAADALRFLVTRAENEPTWLRYIGVDFWNAQGYRVSNLFHSLGHQTSRDLEPRLESLVVKALREGLEREQFRHRALFHDNDRSFWKAKRDVFLQVARDALTRAGDHHPALLFVTSYMYHGLSAYGEAITALQKVHARGKLSPSGRHSLASMLHGRERWEETIAMTQPLIQRSPEDLTLRLWQMDAAHGLKRDAFLKQTLSDAETWLKTNDRWHENAIARLGAGALRNLMYEDTVRLYGEAIALRTRSASNRGVGDGAVSGYYGNVARAHSGLGHTDAAVDAASGAIVSWGHNVNGRTAAIKTLVHVLQTAKDLDAYVTRFEKRLVDDGQENPIVRKAIGRALMELSRPGDAARHFDLAITGSPVDLDLHELAYKAHKAAKNHAEADARMLAWAKVAVRDVSRWRALGDLRSNMSDRDGADRAWTSMVEATPGEAEGHLELGRVRGAMNRWADALHHAREATRLRPEHPSGLLDEGKALVKLDRKADATLVLEKIRGRKWVLTPFKFDEKVKRLAQMVR